jgi:hypothetical protein
MENFLEIDETQDALISLQMMNKQLDNLERTGNTQYWKWVIIGLHNALNGFMVLALRGTNNLNVLTEKCAKQWLIAYYSNNGKYPEPKLDNFLNLYKKIKSGKMNLYSISKSFTPSGIQDISVKKLNKLRNDFVHFVPKNWLIEVSGMPQISDDCLDVISFLAFDCGNVMWQEDDLETQTRELIEKAKQSLALIKKAYSS